MSRKTAREQAFKLIYERCVDAHPDEFEISEQLENRDVNDPLFAGVLDSEDIIYVRKVYGGVDENFDFLKTVVERFSKGFTFERIYKIDCALIMLASYEILYLDDIPVKVSVNEAVELAKKYSTDKSVSFINGILSSVISHKEELLIEQSSQDN